MKKELLKFSYFKLPLRVFNLEEKVEDLEGYQPTSEEVLKSIQDMDETQKEAVLTALGITKE